MVSNALIDINFTSIQLSEPEHNQAEIDDWPTDLQHSWAVVMVIEISSAVAGPLARIKLDLAHCCGQVTSLYPMLESRHTVTQNSYYVLFRQLTGRLSNEENTVDIMQFVAGGLATKYPVPAQV